MGKKKDPPKVQPALARSAYGGINEYDVDFGPFSSAVARKEKYTDTSGKKPVQRDRLRTSASLSSGLQGIYDSTQSGMQSNMDWLKRNPTEQLQDLDAGNNSFYNLQSLMNQRQLDQQIGQAQMRFSRNGLENSTVRGGFEGALANDAILRDLSTRHSSLEYQNATANQNAGTQLGVMQGLAGLTEYPMALANSNMLTGFASQDMVSQFNAQQQQRANELNTQYQMQTDEMNRKRGIGYALGNAAGWLGGPILGPVAGGAFGYGDSAMIGAGAMMNTVGSFVGAGGMGSGMQQAGLSAQPSYTPTSQGMSGFTYGGSQKPSILYQPVQQTLYGNSNPFIFSSMGA